MGYIAIHTKKFKNDLLTCTFETFDDAIEAFNRCHDLVYKNGFFGAYMIDNNGDCVDRCENLDVKHGEF